MAKKKVTPKKDTKGSVPKAKKAEKVVVDVLADTPIVYVGRRVSSTSEGTKEKNGDWKVITKMIEERLPEGSEKWEKVVFDVMVYGNTFAEAHHQSTVFLLNEVISMGGGEVVSLFDLERANEKIRLDD